MLRTITLGFVAWGLLAQTTTQIDYNTQVKNKPTGSTYFGIDISQNPGVTNGGYINFKPVDYNPYNNPTTCFDLWGNPVQQPLPAVGANPFGTNDIVMWNSLSPSLRFTGGAGLVQPVVYDSSTSPGPCGIPLNVNLIYGLNINGYFFARGGLATDQGFYNAIQALQGGVLANSFTAGVYYPPGTMTTSGPVPNPGQYLGGHTDTGHSIGPPAAGTIATVTNPFSGGEGLVAGMIYFDDALLCERVYNGASWSCIGPSSPNFTWDNTTNTLTITRSGLASGIISPIYNANVSGLSLGAKTFQNSDGSFTIDYQGNGAFQSVRTNSAVIVGISTNTGGVPVCVTSTGVLYKSTMGAC